MERLFPLILVVVLLLSSACPGYAAGNSLEAQYEKGVSYFKENDFDIAFSYFQISGEVKGYAPSQNMLGICYRDGLGTDQNPEEAEKYFKLSAEQGYAPAQENLTALEGAREAKIKEKQGSYQAAMNLYFAGEYEAAKEAFEILGDYERSADFAAMCRKTLQETGESKASDLSDVSVDLPEKREIRIGDYIEFGAYEQDNDLSNGKEPIEWLVLDTKEGKALLISRYALDRQRYNTKGDDSVTWETSTLRQWLNSTFLNAAFDSGEQKKILMTTVTADKNPDYNTNPGYDTQDQVFLLSIPEAKQYFSTKEKRICKGTKYCNEQGITRFNDDNSNCQWWLRSPGGRLSLAADVFSSGTVGTGGSAFNYGNNAVRPTLWINLES